MVNVEELDPEPFIALLDRDRPADRVPRDRTRLGARRSTVRCARLDEELADSTATVTVSAADPMIAVRKR